MQTHKDANGKKALRFDPARRIVEIVQRNFKVIVQFKPDGTVDITNYNVNGKPAMNFRY